MSVSVGSPIRVLCVDDDEAMADVTARRLAAEDGAFEPATAVGADAAEAHIDAEPVDCVVSDYDMPGRDGLDLLAAVRADHPDLPFILYTAKGSEEVASDAISAGVTDYVQKDVSGDPHTLLANRVRQAVDRARTDREMTWYRTVVEAVDDFVYALDDDGVFQFVANAEGLTGYEPEELLGERVSLLMDEDSRQAARDHIDLLREADHRTSIQFEREVTTASGATVRCVDHMALLPAPEGEFRGTAGIVRRLTDQARHREELQRVAETVAADVGADLDRLRAALDDAGDGDAVAEARRIADRLDESVADLVETVEAEPE
ncbi:response regulator [Haloarcula litorea]|uniref:response regulator n=1 Tax=Haloarcula litorea TaxID=3032579 RepID=UPI0023E885EC|nr:response regulator [Halomicroarcula sp. GDY20]